MNQKKSKKSSPRIKIIQKIYNSMMNPGVKLNIQKANIKNKLKTLFQAL